MPVRTLAPALAICILLGTASSFAEPLSEGDRQRLLSHLELTESWLGDEVKGLSAAQLSFQMTPESWSIAEVVEHLAIAEPQYWDGVGKSLAQPPAAGGNVTDADILWYGIDRTQRDRTGDARVPKGKFKNAAESLAEFRKLRATIREFSKTTKDDLRGHRLQGGNMQVYQWVLMISTHAQRHILQIREIKAHPKYPKG
jgi:DinB family protein